MSERAIDAMSRRAADLVSRRNSILALGGAALAAAVAEPAGSRNKANKKARKKVRKKCRSQVAPCRAFLAGFCFGDADCEAALLPCCEHLAQCDPGAMFQCMFSCGCGGLEPPTPPEE